MTVTFQVGDREFGGAGNLEIDFWVRELRIYTVQSRWLAYRLWNRLFKAAERLPCLWLHVLYKFYADLSFF